MLNFKPAFSLSSFIFIKRLSSSSSLSDISVVSSACMRLLIFLPEILIPVCDSCSMEFHMTIHSLDVHLWNQSVVPCPVLTVVSWPAHIFLRRQVKWSVIPAFLNFPQFVAIYTVTAFGIVNKVDVFLELSCIFSDRMDVGSLTSGSSVFSKSSLNIWKFTVHGPQPCLTQWNDEPCHVGPPKTDRS